MYILKLWNKKWGKEARFVGYDTGSKKYAEFDPRNPKSTKWVSQNLTQAAQYKGWTGCYDEPIMDLADATI